MLKIYGAEMDNEQAGRETEARRRLLGLLGSDFRSTDGDGARARVLSPPQLCLHVKCLWDAVAVEVAVAVVSEVEDRCGSAPGLTEGLGHLPKSR